MSFTIALCDDDAEQLNYIRGILSAWAADRNLSAKITEYSGAEQFLFNYPAHPCDLLLLDIEMQGLNGIELAKRLREKNDMLPIIFVTGFSEYVSEGYDVEALYYLLKPLDREKLCAVLDKYISRKGQKTEEVLVRQREATTHISAERIVYIEAFGRKSRLALVDGSLLSCNQNIGQFEQLSDFFHCHRSYLVNLRYVKSVGKETIALDTGEELPLSRRLYKNVNQRFISFYQGEQTK